MKALNFKTNSWHYYIAKNLAHYDPRCDNTDICTYLRHVMGGSIFLCVLFTLGSLVAFAFINMFFGIGFSLWYGHWIFTELGEVMFIITSLASLGIGLYFIYLAGWKWFDKRNDVYQDLVHSGKLPPKPDSFVKHAYKSWKEKYCVQIAFSDEDGRMVGQQDDDF
jgi:hypothetical protein